MINRLIAGSIKNIYHYTNSVIIKNHVVIVEKLKIGLNLSKYDLKGASGVDASNLGVKKFL